MSGAPNDARMPRNESSISTGECTTSVPSFIRMTVAREPTSMLFHIKGRSIPHTYMSN